MNASGRNHFRIVLTGGPGGGKSTAADLFRREIGDRIVIVPETATMLFTGGFPRVGEPTARAATQQAIFHAQVALEDIQGARYPGRVGTSICASGSSGPNTRISTSSPFDVVFRKASGRSWAAPAHRRRERPPSSRLIKWPD